MTNEEFIEKAKEIHCDKYDYSKVEYINGQTEVCIICPIHGEFWQKGRSHLKGYGCKKCGIERNKLKRSKNLDEFIEEAKKVHGDKYNYSKVEYVNCSTKVCIICPIHGEFWQIPNSHLRGFGCNKCTNNNVKTTDEFINILKKKYGENYDYSKVEYVNAHTKVCIICPIHGEFWQTPHNLLSKKLNKCCSLCNKKSLYKSITKNLNETFIEKAVSIYGNKYDYSKVNIDGNKSVIIIDKLSNNEFKVKPHLFLNGYDYNNFLINKNKLKDDFIKKAKKIHGDKYDYSKVDYINNSTKVCIICPIHGEFWQKPTYHLQGCCCQLCSQNKHKSEQKLFSIIKENFNDAIYEYRDKELFGNGMISFDIMIPSIKTVIEYQGIQHFKPIKFFGNFTRFNERIKYDKFKKELCDKFNINIIYFTFEGKYIPNDYFGEIYSSVNDLLFRLKQINEQWKD